MHVDLPSPVVPTTMMQSLATFNINSQFQVQFQFDAAARYLLLLLPIIVGLNTIFASVLLLIDQFLLFSQLRHPHAYIT